MKIAPKLTEKAFQAQVVKLAKLYGWLVFHPYDSRRSEKGFPDLVLAHPKWGLAIFAELKTDTGKLSPEQDQWLTVLDDCNQWSLVWRPKDWPDIEAILTGRSSP